jgi:hypothetical protein
MRLAPDHAHAPLDEDLILYIDDLRCSPAFEDCDDVDALERLMQERPNASDEELIATYRSYEAETAALLARESIWGSVVRVANALLEKGKLQDEQAVGLLSSGVKGGDFLDEARHIA